MATNRQPALNRRQTTDRRAAQDRIAIDPTEPILPLLMDTTYVAPSGATIVVPDGGNFQTALNNANPGDTITLNKGSTYTGNFTLPAKGGSSYIHIRSSAPLTTEGFYRLEKLHNSIMVEQV